MIVQFISTKILFKYFYVSVLKDWTFENLITCLTFFKKNCKDNLGTISQIVIIWNLSFKLLKAYFGSKKIPLQLYSI